MFNKNSLESVEWENFFKNMFESLYFLDLLNFQRKFSFSFIFAFENISLETLSILYLLEQKYSFIQLKKIDNYKTNVDLESHYQVNNCTNKSKLHMSTLGILLNTNPRYEGYILNLSLRQRFLKGNFKLFSIGPLLDFTFPTHFLGSNFKVFKSIGEGTHLVCQDLKNAKFPVFITNSEIFKREEGKSLTKILKYTNVVNKAWNGINLLHHNIGSAGISHLNNFLPLSLKNFVNFFGLYFINIKLDSSSNFKKIIDLHLLNMFNLKQNNSTNLLIEQKSIMNSYDKVNLNNKNYFYLPSNLFFEDNETFINTQGLIKRTTKLIDFNKHAKSNWQIIRKFYAQNKNLLFFNNKKNNNLINLDCVNLFNFKTYVNFQFFATQALTSLSFYLTKQNKPVTKDLSTRFKNKKVKIFNTKVKPWLDDFFSNTKDTYSYNSFVLANCSKITRLSSTNFF